jgi:serine/threonine protein phosphatase 1
MHNGMRLQRFARNTQGRDFAVGDIHGCFSKLDAALCQVRFSPVHDRLFAVGDLVDRGPESAQVLEWLDQP